MKQIAFIVHGKMAHRDKQITSIKETFADSFDCRFMITEYTNHAVQLSQSAVSDGADYIISVGGDGSLNEVANGVMKNPERAKQIQVGLLPHGTGNDFAKTVRVSKSISDLKGFIESGSFKPIDLGLADFTDGSGVKTQRYFINITDVGIGGVIAKKLAGSSKILGPTITYQKAILSTLFTYQNVPVKVTADSFSYTGNTMAFIMANGKYFGAGLGIAPDANVADGLCSLITIGDISILDYLRNLGRIKKCLKLEHPKVQYASAKQILVESTEKELPIDMDGEFIGYTPLKIRVIPGAVNFLCPL
jgi:diacylglycerol kinase (ATP)